MAKHRKADLIALWPGMVTCLWHMVSPSQLPISCSCGQTGPVATIVPGTNDVLLLFYLLGEQSRELFNCVSHYGFD